MSVSDLCDEMGHRPTVFYRREKELFENGAAAFGPEDVTIIETDYFRLADDSPEDLTVASHIPVSWERVSRSSPVTRREQRELSQWGP